MNTARQRLYIVLGLFILFCMLLTGCGNKEYTIKDVNKFNASKLNVGSVELRSTETCNTNSNQDTNPDTIWTFNKVLHYKKGWLSKTKDENFEYHVICRHYMAGIDATSFKQTELLTDFELNAFNRALKSGDIKKNWDDEENEYYNGDNKYPIRKALIYTISSRDELAKKAVKCKSIWKGFKNWKKNRKLKQKMYARTTNKVSLAFTYKDEKISETYIISLKEADDAKEIIERRLLDNAYELQDYQLLAQFTDDEINDYVSKLDD